MCYLIVLIVVSLVRTSSQKNSIHGSIIRLSNMFFSKNNIRVQHRSAKNWNIWSLELSSEAACFISGATQIRAGVVHPEVIIQKKKRLNDSILIDLSKLKVGGMARIICKPYFGKNCIPSSFYARGDFFYIFWESKFRKRRSSNLRRSVNLFSDQPNSLARFFSVDGLKVSISCSLW